METLERSQVCRLCGKQAAITVNIFGKPGNHAKINLILPILVHKLDLLPKHVCHPCNYKLQEFYKFYEDCLRTDADLKSQLSWMQGSEVREKIVDPMVQINGVKVKIEPPEYEEQEAILKNEKLNNSGQNHYMTFGEKFARYPGTKCPHCGCYCGNRNRVDDHALKNFSKNRYEDINSMKKTQMEYSPKDLVRRNLFVTDIVEDKNLRVKTEIPICNGSKRLFNEKTMDNMFVKLDRLSCQRNSVDDNRPKTKADNVSKEIPFRALRPRKNFVVNLTNKRSKFNISKNTNRQFNVKRITRRSKKVSDSPPIVKIKVEASDDCDRSLRPRTETIDYAESRRRNPFVRDREVEERSKQTDKKSIILRDNTVNGKVANVVDKNVMPIVKRLSDVNSPMILTVKLERKNSTEEFLEKPMRSNRENISGKIKKEIVDGEISFKRSVENSSNSESRAINCSDKTLIGLKKNSNKNYRKSTNLQSTLCLRSQIGCLKNGKKRTFDLVLDEPKKSNFRICSQRLSSNSIKGKKLRINHNSEPTIQKYQDCNICRERFASHELYRLHSCYANKRH